jgi:AraC-like DNA-binding protein
MAKKIFFAIVLFSIIYILSYKIYHSWLNKNYKNNQVYILKWIYKLVIISAFISFLWAPYSISAYAIFTFKLSLYALLCIITIRIGANFFLKTKMVLLERNKEICIDKEKPSEEILKKTSWLKEQMATNLFYLNSELTLKSLGDSLNIHPNVLSKVINDGLDKSFSDFVNEYRVNAFIDKLHTGNYSHITLLGISFECGFNSKTTFNRVFKNIKGITPLNYKKSIKNKPE